MRRRSDFEEGEEGNAMYKKAKEENKKELTEKLRTWTEHAEDYGLGK